MGYQNVEHACGHTHAHQLFGKHTERDRKAEWLAKQDCPACEREALAKQNAASAQQNADKGLPKLEGSEKQVAWAESIRAVAIPKLHAGLAQFNALVDGPNNYSEAARSELHATARQVVESAASEKSSRWWIDCGQRFTSDRFDAQQVAIWVMHEIKDRGLAPISLAESKAQKS